MARPVLDADHFHNEDAAFEYVEAQLWPHGPTCPHCGNADDAKIGRLSGKSSRPGLRKCYVCRKTFTVRMGSIFEDSHFPLRLWLQAIQLITASKKGVSTRQIQRTFNRLNQMEKEVCLDESGTPVPRKSANAVPQ